MPFQPNGLRVTVFIDFQGEIFFHVMLLVYIVSKASCAGKTHTWYFLFKKHNFMMTGYKLLFLLQRGSCYLRLPFPGENRPFSLSTCLPPHPPPPFSVFPQPCIATWTLLESGSPHSQGLTAASSGWLVLQFSTPFCTEQLTSSLKQRCCGVLISPHPGLSFLHRQSDRLGDLFSPGVDFQKILGTKLCFVSPFHPCRCRSMELTINLQFPDGFDWTRSLMHAFCHSLT